MSQNNSTPKYIASNSHKQSFKKKIKRLFGKPIDSKKVVSDSPKNRQMVDLPHPQYHKTALNWSKQGRKDDLSNFDLRDVDLRKIDLAGANLSKARLDQAILREANLSEANLTGANLSEADLSRASLAGANLTNADLRWADLSGVNLAGANLEKANLEGVNLFKSNLKGSSLKGANLKNANLALANLRETKLDNTVKIDDKWHLVWQIVNQGAAGQTIDNVDLRGADLHDTNLKDAHLDQIDLSYADLSGANLTEANLQGANLRNANLERTSLKHTNLCEANLRNVRLNGANLEGTRLDNSRQLDDKWHLVWQIANEGKQKPKQNHTTATSTNPETDPIKRSSSTINELWKRADLGEFPAEPWYVRAETRILLIASVILLGIGLGYIFWVRPALQQPLPTAAIVLIPTKTPTPKALLAPSTPSPKATPIIPVSLPVAGNLANSEPAQTQPNPEDGVIKITPKANAVGWASSVDGQAQLNDPNIHVGLLSGHIYHGAIQFDLSHVPPNALITSASLELVGLGEQNLQDGGLWYIRLLDTPINAVWPTLTFDALHNAAVDINILPALTSAGLGRGKVNTFPFGPEQIAVLQKHLGNGVVSFRLDGPTSGDDNFFTWDSGYRNGEVVDTPPVLRIVAVSRAYVVITSTPTPENAFTAVAQLDPDLKDALPTGTPTLLPPHWVTPIVVTVPPPPANEATATYQAELTTAEAIAFGTATATPINVWTATSTATPTPAEYKIVTGTPTPLNLVTVAAQAAEATQIAQTIGTYTPVPQGWVTPIIVTPMLPPENTATAEFQAQVATAQAVLSGPGAAIWTATPTPIFIPVMGDVATPWASPTPTATPPTIPNNLVGKIAFLSNRSGGGEPLADPLVYIINPDGSNLAVLTDRTFYDLAIARDHYSADQRYRAFIKDALQFNGGRVPTLYFYDYFYNTEDQITNFGSGWAWDAVWSPASEQIAFVSNDSQDDEIWIINRDGSNLKQLTEPNEQFNAREIGKDTFVPEVNRHPSWSPDGSQIVFWSTRNGHGQLWIMDVDGSNLRSLSTTAYDDWDPVWIKYTDPPRPAVPVQKIGPEMTPTREDTEPSR